MGEILGVKKNFPTPSLKLWTQDLGTFFANGLEMELSKNAESIKRILLMYLEIFHISYVTPIH